MKRKFLAAAVLGVMVSVTPAGAYAASTETSPLPVNSESETTVQSEAEETTPAPTETPEVTPSETPAPTEAPITTPTEIPSEISTLDSAVSSLKEGWNSVEQDGKKLFQYGVLDENNKVVAATGALGINGVDYAFDENGYMLTGEVELTDEDGKTGIYYFETEGEDPAKDELGSRQQGICEGKVFAPELTMPSPFKSLYITSPAPQLLPQLGLLVVSQLSISTFEEARPTLSYPQISFKYLPL